MQTAPQFDRLNEILICCHSYWKKEYGFVVVPEGISLYLYAPLGAVLSRAVPRAIAAGMIINPGDLMITRMMSVMYLREDRDNNALYTSDFKRRNDEVQLYPKLFHPGETIPNYQIVAAGSNRIEPAGEIEISVLNVDDMEQNRHILDILVPGSGRIYHYGGVSWERSSNGHREKVAFKDPVLESKYSQY